jgi:enoyl-[acyl-carrier-protein] reductase (NADH)
VTCGAVETFSRILAGELGANGIRVICLRSDAIPEALATSHACEVFRGFAERAGITVEEMLVQRALTGTLLKCFPTLAEVGNFAAVVASDRASAMTGAIANLTCGSLVDANASSPSNAYEAASVRPASVRLTVPRSNSTRPSSTQASISLEKPW